MKRLGYWLGTVSFIWLMIIGGADFLGPFWKHALIILAGVAVGIVGLFFSVWLVWQAQQNERLDYLLLIEGKKSSFLRQRRRIPALKKQDKF